VRLRGRRVAVTVRGAGAQRVRVALTRGKRPVAARTVRARRGTAQVTFRVRRAGRYSVHAKLLGGVRLQGRSKPVRVR
jgi:hypothetical protein